MTYITTTAQVITKLPINIMQVVKWLLIEWLITQARVIIGVVHYFIAIMQFMLQLIVVQVLIHIIEQLVEQAIMAATHDTIVIRYFDKVFE